MNKILFIALILTLYMKCMFSSFCDTCLYNCHKNLTRPLIHRSAFTAGIICLGGNTTMLTFGIMRSIPSMIGIGIAGSISSCLITGCLCGEAAESNVELRSSISPQTIQIAPAQIEMRMVPQQPSPEDPTNP